MLFRSNFAVGCSVILLQHCLYKLQSLPDVMEFPLQLVTSRSLDVRKFQDLRTDVTGSPVILRQNSFYLLCGLLGFGERMSDLKC